MKNEMNAEDLMLNDLVMYHHRPFRVKELSSLDIADIFGRVAITGNMENLRKEIEPIPLTEEILKKNGFFGRKEYKSCVIDDSCTIILDIDEGINIWCSEPNDWQHLTYTLPYPRYVHELQHALRICGIEKGIEL